MSLTMLCKEQAPKVNYSVNDIEYNMSYHLKYGIYSERTTFVKNISMPQEDKRILVVQHQECARKDIEWSYEIIHNLS